MPRLGRLPPAPKYVDLPKWSHNCDNVETRILNAGWNALFNLDLCEFSFNVIAREIGVTTPAVYHYFPNILSLGAELAVTACSQLRNGMVDAIDEKSPPPMRAVIREAVYQYMLFAEKRPRHFALGFSPRFRDPHAFPRVAHQQQEFLSVMEQFLEIEIDRKPTPAEVLIFWGLVHGPAALVAAGHKPQHREVMKALELFFAQLSR